LTDTLLFFSSTTTALQLLTRFGIDFDDFLRALFGVVFFGASFFTGVFFFFRGDLLVTLAGDLEGAYRPPLLLGGEIGS
jgi:hypothetical protein